jgi:hypothetical protein
MLASHELAPSSDRSRSGVILPEAESAPEPVPRQTVDPEGQATEIVNFNKGDDDAKSDTFEDAKSEKAESNKEDSGDVLPDDVKSDKADEDGAPPPNPELAGPTPLHIKVGQGPLGPVHEGWRCDGCRVRVSLRPN